MAHDKYDSLDTSSMWRAVGKDIRFTQIKRGVFLPLPIGHPTVLQWKSGCFSPIA